jgi:integrase
VAGFHKESSAAADSLSALGKAGSTKNRKLDHGQGFTGTSPPCPQCGSDKAWKDGIRETAFGPVQRYLCRNCAYRFSDPNSKQAQRFFNGSGMSEHVERISTKKLKSKTAILSYCREAYERKSFRKDPDSLWEMKHIGSERASAGQKKAGENLAEVETRKQERPMREGTKLDTEIMKGLLIQYMAWLEKENYDENSSYPKLLKMLVRRGANLLDPENVKSLIAKQPWKDGVKALAVQAYDIMAKMLNIQWAPPKYKRQETLPWIPEESELDQLIASCKSRRMAAFLQTLKETFADPGEVLRLRWIDVDVSNSVITINRPVKNHSPRQLKVQNRLIAMLNALPKKSELIFPTTYASMYIAFLMLRRRAAKTLQNPRLLKISFRTFRHWGATMTYHYTRKILLVQKLLGHKSILNTMVYTRLIHFKDDEFEVETASNVEEAKDLLKAGFDYITDKNGIMLFRRPKRFANIGVSNET